MLHPDDECQCASCALLRAISNLTEEDLPKNMALRVETDDSVWLLMREPHKVDVYIHDLDRDLEDAVKNEDYEAAARIRDELKKVR